MASKYRRAPEAPPSRLARLPLMQFTQRLTDREGPLQRFYRDTRSELRKVVWPTREQATNLTLLVCAASIVVGAFLGGLDLLFAEIFKRLLGRV